MDERQRLMAPEDLDWARLGDALRWLLLLL